MAYRRLRSVVGGRGLLLLPLAALLVHQLRFTLAYGGRADQVLSAEGHSYLNSLAPWLVALLALAFGSFLVRVARAGGGRGDDHPRRSLLGLWLLAWSALVAIYVVQEFLEGLFAVGHPGGVAGIFGHGGWWALVVAGLAGAAVAGLLRVAFAIVSVAERLAAHRAPAGPAQPARSLRAVSLPLWPPLASAAAGRAPPAA